VTRLVIKLGSSSIASGEGLALDVIADLVTQIAAAQRAGHQVVLVTSGAARLGRRLLAFEGPTARTGPELQRLLDAARRSVRQDAVGGLQETLRRYDAPPGSQQGPLGVALAASVGQPALMALYRQLAAAVGMEVCQILLSRSDLDSATAMRDVGTVLISALGQGLLPIVNGNDTTDPRAELDNDQIAVAVAVAAEASRLTFLTNVRGVFADDAMRQRIARLTPEEARSVRGAATGEGRGGMRSKLNAAARAAYCGVECAIGSARDADVVARSLSSRARVGTVVRAVGGQLAPPQRWVGGMAYPMGSIGINREAERSLRTGSTLFLSGVKRVDGDFEPGAVVELVDVRHPERLIGRGSVAMPSAVLRLLRALSPDEVADVISIVLRLRHGAEDQGTPLLDPDQFADVRDLGRRNSQAARQALSELGAASGERIRALADALLAAQPRVCAAMLAAGSFRTGEVGPGAPDRRAVRDLHAIHRDSLVVFGGGAAPGAFPGAAPDRELAPDLAVAPGHVLDTGQRLESHRSAGVQLLGGHPDLQPVPEFAAVGEPGRAVDEHAAGVDGAGEPAGDADVLGDDRLGVAGAPPADVRERVVQAVHDADREHEVQVLGRPVRLGRGLGVRPHGADSLVAPQSHPELGQLSEHLGQPGLRDRRVHQQRLRRVAHARPRGLGVHHDLGRHRQIR
jgi:glutamate 5-kinase